MEKYKKPVIYILLIAGSFIMLFPFAWMISASLKTNLEVFQYPIRWLPENPRWENYINIWKRIDFLTYYKNTLVLTVLVTIFSLITSSLAAYAFSKINFPERNSLFLLYVATIAVPFQVIMIPQFIMMRNLGLNDTLWALVLIQSFSPFGVFLLRQFYMSIPNELCEAARIDGLSDFGIYRKIVLPLSKPALATLAIFQFVFVWNDYLGPLIYLSSDKNKTIQLGIKKFVTQYSTEYSLIMAASVVALIPVVILFIFTQKYYVEGIAMSGLKG
ncbi:MAG TPA: carbohydrate ABC transporter permease [Halanaerobiales bacterium]|nr:carbohydrate ABC transporter permease [Halanaerobiales bacterium]